MTDHTASFLVRAPQLARDEAHSESVNLLKDPTLAAPEGFWENAADFFKSVPSGAVGGLLAASNQPPHWAFPQDIYDLDIRPLRDEGKRNVLKQMHSPRGRAGRYGYVAGEGLGNPYSYVGPGSMPFKVGSTIASSAASEAAGEAAEGTKWELPARVGGAVLGAYAYGKAAGPRAPKAALPTAAESHVTSDLGIDAIRSSNLVLKPDAVTSWAKATIRELKGAKYTPGQHGNAPETSRILRDIYFPPGISAWPDQFESIKQNLQRVASRGTPRDAEAASIALQRLKEFTENIPQGAVLRGDAGNYVRLMEAARADRAAAERLQRLDPRLTNAESAADKQPGGKSVIPQAALTAASYGARKASEAITKSRADEFIELLLKNSPEYQRRLANLPPADTVAARAAMVRALLGMPSDEGTNVDPLGR
jgi:hypothetical protein